MPGEPVSAHLHRLLSGRSRLDPSVRRRQSAARGRLTHQRKLLLDILEQRLVLSGETITSTIGTLPAGKSIQVLFDTTIDASTPKGIDQIYNQGTVSGSNFSSVRTDDPTVVGTTDPTARALDRAPQVAQVFVRSTGWNAAF